jgi:hypothetical protein
MKSETLQERVQQRKERPNPPHKQQQQQKDKRSRLKPQSQKKRITRVRPVTRRNSSCRIYSTPHTTPQRKATERGESTLTAFHTCHRPRIPGGHVLVERRCGSKHCKRGCNKEKERSNPPHKQEQQKRSRFKPQTNKKNKTCENCDPTRVVVYIEIHQKRERR